MNKKGFSVFGLIWLLFFLGLAWHLVGPTIKVSFDSDISSKKPAVRIVEIMSLPESRQRYSFFIFAPKGSHLDEPFDYLMKMKLELEDAKVKVLEQQFYSWPSHYHDYVMHRLEVTVKTTKDWLPPDDFETIDIIIRSIKAVKEPLLEYLVRDMTKCK